MYAEPGCCLGSSRPKRVHRGLHDHIHAARQFRHAQVNINIGMSPQHFPKLDPEMLKQGGQPSRHIRRIDYRFARCFNRKSPALWLDILLENEWNPVHRDNAFVKPSELVLT
ncbi:hypothetical protein WJ36_10725 [Burkholderia ubonensis]|nr:hypothetical protein WJ36_10725 [Burkholderia ubonensis]